MSVSSWLVSDGDGCTLNPDVDDIEDVVPATTGTTAGNDGEAAGAGGGDDRVAHRQVMPKNWNNKARLKRRLNAIQQKVEKEKKAAEAAAAAAVIAASRISSSSECGDSCSCHHSSSNNNTTGDCGSGRRSDSKSNIDGGNKSACGSWQEENKHDDTSSSSSSAGAAGCCNKQSTSTAIRCGNEDGDDAECCDSNNFNFGTGKMTLDKDSSNSKTDNSDDDDDDSPASHIGATERVYVRTWGCSHNNSDGEYMSGQLAASGYRLTDSESLADVWILNSCTVKNPSEDNFVNTVRRAKQAGKHIVLAGCVPQGQRKHPDLQGLSVVGVQQIDRVVEVVEETVKGNTVRLFGGKKDGGARLSLPKIRKNPIIEIIPINTGCLNQCTYCKTKHARGDLRSYTVQEIVERVRTVIDEGVVEIHLTSEDTGTYGRDIGTTLPALLWAIVEVMPEGTMLRLGMGNPPFMMEYIEELCAILRHPRVFGFLHVPVQAASDHVLEDMKRQYSCADFKKMVDHLTNNVPEMTVATDIICGFPTETTEDFDETLKLMEQYKFPVMHISQFYPRHGTPAARMKRVPTSEVKRRSRALTSLFNSYTTLDDRVGKTYTVLCTEVSHDGVNFVCHNKNYDQVLVPMADGLMGKMFDVKITRAIKWGLFAEVIPESLARAPKRPPPLPLGQHSQGLMPARSKAVVKIRRPARTAASPPSPATCSSISHSLLVGDSPLLWFSGFSAFMILLAVLFLHVFR